MATFALGPLLEKLREVSALDLCARHASSVR